MDKKDLLTQILANGIKNRLEILEKRFKTEATDISTLETTVDVLKSKGNAYNRNT
jgi:hypothetical protein